MQLLLSNPSKTSVAYKVKCTDIAFYAVKPVTGIIPAGREKFPVTVVLFPLTGPNRKPNVELFDRYKQRFMVEAAVLTPGCKFETAEPSPATAKLVVSSLKTFNFYKLTFLTHNQLKEAEENGKVMISRLSCAFDDYQLNLALEDSRKSAISSIRTNAIGGNNGMPALPVIEEGGGLTDQDEKTLMLILAAIIVFLAVFYFIISSTLFG